MQSHCDILSSDKPGMSSKRTSSVALDENSPSLKRQRESQAAGAGSPSANETSSKKRRSYPRKPQQDAQFGQKFAFPGIDDESYDDASSNDGGPSDALEYLRQVRSEAKALPAILLSKGDSIETAQDVHSGGICSKALDIYDEGTYSDGVWIARQAETMLVSEMEDDDFDPQEEFYSSLCERFEHVRSMLKSTPPANVIASLDDSHPIHFPRQNKAASREWKRLLRETDPKTAQLACMDTISALGVLNITAKTMLETVEAGNPWAVKRLSAWIWGLLGRCRELGQLSSAEVSDLRNVGKAAKRALNWIKDWERMSYENEYYNETETGNTEQAGEVESDLESIYLPEDIREGVHKMADAGEKSEGKDTRKSTDIEGEAAALKAAKERLTQSLDEPESTGASEEQDGATDEAGYDDEEEWSLQAHAMVDMVLTIVGEFFGQRDLLEAREIWDEQS